MTGACKICGELLRPAPVRRHRGMDSITHDVSGLLKALSEHLHARHPSANASAAQIANGGVEMMCAFIAGFFLHCSDPDFQMIHAVAPLAIANLLERIEYSETNKCLELRERSSPADSAINAKTSGGEERTRH